MSNPRIIYPTDEGGVAVLIPAPEWLAQEGNTLEALAAIRAKYADMQVAIDAAVTPNEIKAALEILA